jgi:hypothetical protein
MAQVTTSIETARAASKLSGGRIQHRNPNTHEHAFAPTGNRSSDQCLAVFLCKRYDVGKVVIERKKSEKVRPATRDEQGHGLRVQLATILMMCPSSRSARSHGWRFDVG